MKLTIELTSSEHDKLQALADARGITPQACIRDFIRACQPDGGKWVHPFKIKPFEVSDEL